ncbi:MAG: 30S ribosomal protein S20 [Clostridia bacterium]|nr:30S ribosomal protein S20 [Clostridia bacterium]
MPNIKSSIKRVKTTATKTAQNTINKSEYKTAVKKFEANPNETSFKTAVKAIDTACAKSILKKNTASRKKSSLAKKLKVAK